MFIFIVYSVCCWNYVDAQIKKSSFEAASFEELLPGMSIAGLCKGDLNSTIPPDVIVIRINPNQYHFSTHHFTSLPGTERPTSAGWREILNAVAVVNAGQYTPEYQHLGWLFSKGKNIGSKLHSVWDGFFAAEPVDDSRTRRAAILDRRYEHIQADEFAYRECIQSLMLFDRNGQIRVKQSQKIARRSAIGEDMHGDILLLTTWSEISLYQFAHQLQQSSLNLKQALSLDGGAEAQLSIKTNSFEINIPYIQIGLPAVLAVSTIN